MNYPLFFDSKNSLNLYGLQESFNFLSTLYNKKSLPKVLMFTGNKGSGKSTLINHFLFSIFDKMNYNFENLALNNDSSFLKQFKNNIFPNIIYFKGSDFKSVKIENIRNLKTIISKSNFLDKERFVIFDDVELFSVNSLNALLKIIEEPSKNNYFFLINNKSRPILETIKSRALEIKIILKENQRLKIINNLIVSFGLDAIIDPQSSKLTPGNFVKFDFICKENNIIPSEDFRNNLSLLLNLYRKNKEILYINIASFLADYYLKAQNKKNVLDNDKFYEIKHFIFDNLNSFVLYNLNQNALINAIDQKINNG